MIQSEFPQEHGRSSLLLCPGPTEVDPKVLQSMSHVAESHFSKPFCNVFGDVLTMLRHLFQSTNPKNQPFAIGGSGSLGWDFVATNFLEPEDSVLTLSTGFFSDGFESCLHTYGLNTKKLTAPFGSAHDLDTVERELKAHKYKMLVATHVETSTAVLTPLQPLRELLNRVSPDTLFVVDGVASVSCEELKFDEWGIDVVVTGSQKAIGCPPGLSIIMVSERALQVADNRRSAPITWYSSLTRWLPIMRKYEAKEPSYFATPPTQVVHALHTALTLILSRPLEERFQQHKEAAAKVRAIVQHLGLKLVSNNPETQANGLTAFWVPEGCTATDLLTGILARGVQMTGGMHAEHGQKYVRFGHMGYSVTHDNGSHIDFGIQAVTDTVLQYYESQQEDFIPLEDAGYAAEKVAWRFLDVKA